MAYFITKVEFILHTNTPINKEWYINTVTILYGGILFYTKQKT